MGASEALAYVDEGSIESLNLIDSDKIETGYYLESNGKKTETSSTSWWVTDYVKVTPGDVLMLYRVNQTSDCPYISFYTGQSEDTALPLWGSNYRTIIRCNTYRVNYGDRFGAMDYALILIPEEAQ